MGQAKRELERRDGLHEQAIDIAIQAGALKRCNYHEEVTLDQMDDEANSRAYAIGTNQWKSGSVDGTREELMDAIKTAIGEGALDCPACEKWKDD